MAIAPVLKTGVRKDLGVRIPRPPLKQGKQLAVHPWIRYGFAGATIFPVASMRTRT